MNVQLSIFEPATLQDSPSAISLPGVAFGALPCVRPDGPMIDRCGPEAVPANRSAQPGNKKDSMTKGTCGPTGSGSSELAAPPPSSESKSQRPSGELIAKTRTCRLCGEEKPYFEFYVNSKGNRPRTCKECAKSEE